MEIENNRTVCRNGRLIQEGVLPYREPRQHDEINLTAAETDEVTDEVSMMGSYSAV